MPERLSSVSPPAIRLRRISQPSVRSTLPIGISSFRDNRSRKQAVGLVLATSTPGLPELRANRERRRLRKGKPSIHELLFVDRRTDSTPINSVAALALYRRGHRDDERRDSLLDALGMPWSRFTVGLHPEIIDALVADWAQDGVLQDACWTTVGRQGPPTHNISYDIARSILVRIHREDPRVPRWLQQEIETGDSLSFMRGLLIALDGKLRQDTPRLIAIELSGVCLVSWGCAGGAQSYLPLSG